MIHYDENVTVLYQVNYWSVPEESLPDCPVVLQCIGLYGALERCVVNVHRMEGTACGRVRLLVETCVIIRVRYDDIIASQCRSSLLTLTWYVRKWVANVQDFGGVGQLK